MLQCGTIYPSPDSERSHIVNGHGLHLSSSIELLRRGLLVEDPISTNCMPVEAIEAVIGAIVGAGGVVVQLGT